MEAVLGCSLPLARPSTVRTNDVGWKGLADLHALADVEIEQLMSCRVVRVDETWQAEVVAAQLCEAHAAGDADRLAHLLCLLVRAEIADDAATRALESITLRVALRCEDAVPAVMASCVRLARLLACKLDDVNGLAHICEDACPVE